MSCKTFTLIGLFILATAGVLIGLHLRGDAPTKIQIATETSVLIGGFGAQAPSNSPVFAAATTSPPQATPPGSPVVTAGGIGAGKAPTISPVQAQQRTSVPSEVLEAARNGLPFFLGRIPPGSKEMYGFGPTDDLSAAQLGGGFQMLTITPAAIKQSSPNSAVSSVLSKTTMWFFPILIESESKAMLVVDRDANGETWKAVSMGYAGLGHELNKILAQWPESKGTHPQLIAVFQAKRFYFTVPEVDDDNLTQIRLPLGGFSGSTMPALAGQSPNNYGTLGLLSNSLEELKPIVLRTEMHANR